MTHRLELLSAAVTAGALGIVVGAHWEPLLARLEARRLARAKPRHSAAVTTRPRPPRAAFSPPEVA